MSAMLLSGRYSIGSLPSASTAKGRQLQVLPLGDEGIGFGNQYLRQDSPGAFART
jgi:hypothetical protein